MNFPLVDLVKGIFEPAAKLVDDLHTSEEERLIQKGKLIETQAVVLGLALEYERKNIESRTQIITSETNSDSWLAKNWRPMTMLTFTGLIVSHWLGYTPPNITDAQLADLMDLIQLGLTGYVVTRSAEKIAKTVAESKVTGK